eukprot:TRINITY_DN44175_c0_g2_i1.p1 TRINITY_DN44175_c0_g2~~TRINITY_DN44175_c0_g2_i1.p1  ORF type:complete len:123 (+),score=5.06 TRINITY_DN44175_c0_g2_i1:155-523(+)
MQYYNFIRFGRKGYEAIINNCLTNTQYLLKLITKNEKLSKVLKNISDAEYMPIVVLTWADPKNRPKWDLKDLSLHCHQHNWTVPSYVLPKTDPDEILSPDESVQVLRIVIQQTRPRRNIISR